MALARIRRNKAEFRRGAKCGMDTMYRRVAFRVSGGLDVLESTYLAGLKGVVVGSVVSGDGRSDASSLCQA